MDSAASVLYDFKEKMGNVAISRCQENEIRELHHWAVQNLKNVQRVCLNSLHARAYPGSKFVVAKWKKVGVK